MTVGPLENLSRVYLEPVLVMDVENGEWEEADAIVDELASRTWQGHNPYAGE